MLFEQFLTQFQRRIRAKNRHGRAVRRRVQLPSASMLASTPSKFPLATEALETRTLLTGFVENGATLDIDVQAGETVTIVANATSYTVSSTGTWSGANSGNVTGNGGSILTVTAAGLGVFDSIRVTDSGAAAAFAFGDSGTNTYGDSINVTLDNPAAETVTFTGSSSFSLAAGISATTAKNIVVNAGSSISVEDGSLTLNANSGATAGNFVGIDLDDADLSSTGTGVISLTATGGNTAGDFGIDVRNGSTIIASGTGATAGGITLNGTAQAAGDDGVHVVGAGTVIRSTDGNVSLTGNSAATDGVQITVGALVESTGTTADAATVTIMGTGIQEGVEVSGANALVRSVRGTIDIDGINNGTIGNEHIGVHVLAGGVIQSTGAAPVDVNGTGGNGAATGDGVRVSDANSAITSATGSILVTGQGGSGSAQFNRGVRVQAAGLISSTGTGATAATITVMGTGGASGTDGNHGISVSGANSAITSIDGNIQLTGQGGTGSTDQHIGVVLLDGGQVRSTGATADASDVTVNGTGGTGTQNNFGVFIEGASSQFISTAGELSVTGIGGSGGNDNRGVNLTQDGTVITTTGAITVMGSASNGNSAGVRLSPTNGGRILSNGSGTITITADGNGTEADLQAGADSLIGDGVAAGATANAAAGVITINADSIDWQASLEVESDGALTIQPRTAGTTIGIGGGTGALNLTQAEINLFQDGFSSITIGSSTAGNVDVHKVTLTDPTTIIGNVISDSTDSPNITMNPTSLTVTMSGTVSPGESPGILNVTGNFAFADGSTFLVEVGGTTPGNTDTNHDQLAATGSVTIGTNVTLSTVQFMGFVPAPGQEFIIISRVGGSGTFDSLGEGATIFGFLGSAFDATITYAGGVGNDDVVLRIADPGVSGLDDVTFAENLVNTSPQVVDSDVTVVDADSADFDNGSLTIVYSVGGGVEDSLSVQNGGNITFNGTNVSFSGVGVIATVNGGNNGVAGSSLIFNLNASATAARVEELLENLTYANSSNTPAATRTISVTLNDGDGNTSAAETAVITVTSNSEPGSLTDLDPVTFLENTVNAAPQIIDANVTFVDADSPTFVDGGNLTVTYAAAGLAQDSLSINNEGNAAGQIGFDGANVSFGGTIIGTLDAISTGAGGVDLKVNLNGSATPTAVDALIQNLTYANSANQPAATRTISVTVDDGDGGVSPAATAVITVTPEEECYVVTTTLDVLDANDGLLSLREAVILANADGENSNIKFGVAGTFTLTIAPGGESTLTGLPALIDQQRGDLDIVADGNLTIDGTSIAGDVIIDGNGASRIFHVQPMTFTLKGLTLQNGAELNSGVEDTTGRGGAIRASANVVIEDSILQNNRSEGAGGAINLSGGGNSLTIRRTTFSNNSAFNKGGAINSERSIAVTIVNSTFSGNTADANGNGQGEGGAISVRMDNSTPVSIDSSTFTLNSAESGGALLWRVVNGGANPQPVIRNTIIAQNTATTFGADIGETNEGGGSTFSPDYDYNIIGNATGVTGVTNGVDNNQAGSTGSELDPMLQALASNGGGTLTHAILAGSVAVDTGNSFGVTTDQRGELRPSDHPAVVNGAGDAADIGAFEIPIFTFNITTVTCIELRYNAGTNEVEIFDPVGLTVLASKNAASLAAVVVNGTDLTDDKLQINFTGFPTSIPIFFNGGLGPSNAGVGADELIFFNNANTATTYDYDGRVVSLDGHEVGYTGLEILANRGTSTTQNFNFTAGSETVSLEDVGTPMPGSPRPNAAGQSTRLNITGVALPQTEFVNPATAGIVNLNLGGGADTVQLTNAVTNFAGSLAIDTGDPGDGDLTSLNLALTVGGRFSVVDSATVAVGAPLTSTSTIANAVSISGGTVNLSDQVTAANSTVVIVATGSIVDGNGAAKNVVATSAVLRATGGVGTAADPIETQVSNLAGTAAGTGFHVSNMGVLDITTVDGTMGIAVSNGGVSVVNDSPVTVSQDVTETNGGNIALTATDNAVGPEPDTLIVNASVQATGGNGNISLAGENVTINSGAFTPTVSTVGGGTITVTSIATSTLGANSTVQSAGGAITFTNDDIVINASATLNSGVGTTTIEPSSNGQLVTLGSAANTLSVSDAELDRITAGVIHVGSAAAGNLTVAENVSPGGTTTLHLETGGSVDDGVGNQTVTVANLAVEATNAVTLEGANDVDTVAISSTNGSVIFTDSDGFTVGTVDSVAGVDGGTGAVALTATTGGVTVSNTAAANDINAGTTIAITLSQDNQTLTIAAGANVESIGGKHVYTADEMDIVGTITATGQDVALQPASAGEAIDLGSAGMDATNDTLELSNAELNAITASVLRIGRDDANASGAILISMPVAIVSPPASATLHLVTGSTVTQNSAFSAKTLGISAGGAVTLNAMTNDVEFVAIRTSSGNVTFEDGNGFSVGSVTSCDPSGGTDTTNGVGTAAGSVSLAAGSGNVTVTNTAAANDVEATGTITVTLMGDDALLTINAGADSESIGGTHKYTADKMDLAGTITATGQIVVLAPNESGEAVDLGSTTNAAADTLELSSAELAGVSASILRVGSATTGAITVSANVTTGAATLSLINNAGISGAGGITGTNLAIQSPGVVNLSAGTHNVGTLAASITGANNAFSFNENDTLTIGTADGITGLTTNNGTATIVAGGLLTIDDDVNVGTGNFVIDTAGAGQNAGDTITAAGFSMMGTGTFTLGEGNDVDTIAASVTGSITFNDVDTLTVGTVGTKVGITTDGNSLALTTAQQLTIGSGAGQDINVGAANVALTATSGGVTENAGSIITAAQLALSGTNAGNFSLSENNAVGLLAASINGTLGFVTTTALEVGTSNSISGVTTNSNAATVQSTGSMTLTQAINTGTAATTLTSTTGGIIDNNGAATNVTASSLSATAAAGIGSGNSLETTVSTLAATNSTSGNIEITNTGAAPLEIGTVGTVVGISNSAAGGSISVTNVGAINTNQNVTADGDIFIKANETAPATTGDDLTIAATVTISSANGNIRLEAGDNVTVTAGSTISAPNGTVTIKGDCNNNDAAGTTIIVNGTVTSGFGLTVNGDTDADSITLGAMGTGGATLNGGAGDDTYNVNFPAGTTFGSAISFSDSGGTDTLNVNGSSDAETFVVRTTATLDTVTRTVPAPDEVLTYGSEIDALNLTGGNANDLFDVQPSMLVPIDINGNSPVFGDPGTPSGAPVGPGDELRFDPFGNPFNIIRKQTIQTTNLGAGGPFFDITFRSIETFGLSPLGTDPGQRFDFDFPVVTNPSFTPITQTGYTSVRPDTLLSGGGGFGWDTVVSSTTAQNYNPTQGELFDLKVDGHTGTSVRRFSVDVAGNGFYSVNVLVGSYFYNLDDVFIRNADNGVTILSGIDVTFGHFTSQRFFVEVKDGSLDLEFGAGTGSSRWEISAVEFVPANNQTIAGAGGNFEADGVTVDSFTAVGADAGSIVTVSTDIGTITSADIDPTIDGIQHQADGTGNVVVTVRRPYHAGEALLSFEQVNGRRHGCILPVYTLPSTRRFDFNHGDSATQTPVVSLANPEGYLGVVETELLTTATSYGWLTEPVSRRAFPVVTKGPLVDLRRDGHMGTGPQTFQTNVPDGTYVVLATLGSSRHTLDDLEVRVNGTVAATDLDILFGQSTQVPFVVTVTNGQIQVTVSDLGGELLWMIQGLEIRDQATDVTALTFINAPGNVTANGTTVTPITISTPGLADGTTVTVSSTLGTITSADTVSQFTGTQLVVAGGEVTFDLRSPTTAGTPTLTVHTLNGDSFGQTTNAAYLNFLPPLLASATVLNSDVDLLTQNQAEAILLEAQAFWAAVPLTSAQRAALDSARLVIADLDSTEALGLADVTNQTIWIDDNGSGLGWDVDGDLSVDSNRYDLLTTVAHELGHLLGLPDLHSHEDSGRLMSGVLNPGETRMTTSASDAFFGSLSKSSDDADPTPFE